MLKGAGVLGRFVPRVGATLARRQLMVASPTVIQQVQASAASDPHVNCFKMVTDGADPVMYVYPSAACRDPPPYPPLQSSRASTASSLLRFEAYRHNNY